MSTFLVETKLISHVSPHPNANRLEVLGFSDLAYTLVAPIGIYRPGDQIVYIPLDAQLPAAIIEELGVAPYLSGPEHNVVQTAVLRGVASQGISAPLSILENRGIAIDTPAAELAPALGIVKFNPEPKAAEYATLYPLPGNRHSYDIENAERAAAVIAYIIANRIEVAISEKLEGEHVGVYYDPSTDSTHLFIRNNLIVEFDPANESFKENPICRLIRHCNLPETARRLGNLLNQPVSIHAEALGAGSKMDYYRLGKSLAPVFDVGIKTPFGWSYLGEDNFTSSPDPALLAHIPRAPQLFRGQLGDFLQSRTLAKTSHGPSVLNPKKLREGIVIKPILEQNIPLELGGGRMIVKQRDPIYLGKTR